MSRTPRIGVPTVVRRTRRTGPYQTIVKPVIDRTAGIIFAVLSAPLVLILAVAARATFGRAIVREPRVGRGGKEFRLFRICTSHKDGRDLRGRGHKVAHFMRQWSLNELPQLWNIVLGQMSLVGPRPLHPDHAAKLEGWQRRRHDVKPGLTGLWQVGARGDGRHLLDNVHYDIQYIDQLSFLADVRILLLSPGMWALRREQHETHRPSRSHRRINHLRLIMTDLLLWPLAATTAVYLWYDFSLAPVEWGRLMGLWLIAGTAQLGWGLIAGLYRGRWRLGSGEETAWVARRFAAWTEANGPTERA